MNMEYTEINTDSEGAIMEISDTGYYRIAPHDSKSARQLYEHQKDAMKALDRLDQEPAFSTLVVMPTGSGKTSTATTWLLRNAVDHEKKVLWIAHRKMLLDQAAQSFANNALKKRMPNTTDFSIRVISGSQDHDRMIDIRPDDDVLVISKDSAARNPKALEKWLKGVDELYFIIDEAHHSTAKSYRIVIDYVKSTVKHVKLIGLTATPIRTAEKEQGLLAKIYKDGTSDGTPDGRIVHGETGIAYRTDLDTLIKKQILSTPVFDPCETGFDYGEDLGLRDWQKIEQFDKLPEDIAKKMARNAARNNLIVQTYVKNRKKYGQTIVFALNVDHAIQLTAVFKKHGVKAGYVVSSIVDAGTGVKIDERQNSETEEAYLRGDLEVLVNVNILTEGADFPQTQTVFLTRPTVSMTLMTQMVGRALRGEKAGGTKLAYIVSFIDNCNDKIEWVSPESVFIGEGKFNEKPSERDRSGNIRIISIAKMEEFARILDDSVDTSRIEAVPFVERIPVGMYMFSYMEKTEDSSDTIDHACQVMVYDCSKDRYEQMMAGLADLFRAYDAEKPEYLSEKILREMEKQCHETWFLGDMIPAYNPKDIRNILRYYAQYSAAPLFYSFVQIDREKLDVGRIAKHIYDEDMRRSEQNAYLNSLWENSDDNILRLFFDGKESTFRRMVEIELEKFDNIGKEDASYVRHPDKRKMEDLPLYKIRQYDPELEKSLRDGRSAKH